jgi:hypothetical protein
MGRNATFDPSLCLDIFIMVHKAPCDEETWLGHRHSIPDGLDHGIISRLGSIDAIRSASATVKTPHVIRNRVQRLAQVLPKTSMNVVLQPDPQNKAPANY